MTRCPLPVAVLLGLLSVGSSALEGSLSLEQTSPADSPSMKQPVPSTSSSLDGPIGPSNPSLEQPLPPNGNDNPSEDEAIVYPDILMKSFMESTDDEYNYLSADDASPSDDVFVDSKNDGSELSGDGMTVNIDGSDFEQDDDMDFSNDTDDNIDSAKARPPFRSLINAQPQSTKEIKLDFIRRKPSVEQKFTKISKFEATEINSNEVSGLELNFLRKKVPTTENLSSSTVTLSGTGVGSATNNQDNYPTGFQKLHQNSKTVNSALRKKYSSRPWSRIETNYQPGFQKLYQVSRTVNPASRLKYNSMPWYRTELATKYTPSKGSKISLFGLKRRYILRPKIGRRKFLIRQKHVDQTHNNFADFQRLNALLQGKPRLSSNDIGNIRGTETNFDNENFVREILTNFGFKGALANTSITENTRSGDVGQTLDQRSDRNITFEGTTLAEILDVLANTFPHHDSTDMKTLANILLVFGSQLTNRDFSFRGENLSDLIAAIQSIQSNMNSSQEEKSLALILSALMKKQSDMKKHSKWETIRNALEHMRQKDTQESTSLNPGPYEPSREELRNALLNITLTDSSTLPANYWEELLIDRSSTQHFPLLSNIIQKLLQDEASAGMNSKGTTQAPADTPRPSDNKEDIFSNEDIFAAWARLIKKGISVDKEDNSGDNGGISGNKDIIAAWVRLIEEGISDENEARSDDKKDTSGDTESTSSDTEIFHAWVRQLEATQLENQRLRQQARRLRRMIREHSACVQVKYEPKLI